MTGTNATAAASPMATIESLWSAILQGDADAIMDCYADEETLHVFVEGPRWQTLGHQAVSRGWHDYCDSSLKVTAIDVTDGPRVFIEDGAPRIGAQATVTAMTGLTYAVAGEDESRHQVFRLTWVMRREADRWRIIHEHGSQPAADPYGTGDWLKEH